MRSRDRPRLHRCESTRAGGQAFASSRTSGCEPAEARLMASLRVTRRRHTGRDTWIEELPACRCSCGAFLFELSQHGEAQWVRCLVGHVVSTRAACPAFAPRHTLATATSALPPGVLEAPSRNGHRRRTRATQRGCRRASGTLFPRSVSATASPRRG